MPSHKSDPHRADNATGAEVEPGQADQPHGSETLTAAAEAAEAAVCGAMLLDVDARDGAATMVGPGDFHRPAHRVLFVAIQAMHTAGQPLDVLTLTDRLATTGQLDEVGGPLGVADLCALEVCPVPQSWRTYTKIVARESKRRRTVARLRKALHRLECGEDPAVVTAELEVAA